MVDHGARNLVLVSRSGTVIGKVKKLVDELTLAGANVLVKRCDVSDKISVDALIRKDMISMPEVGGVVHGAMVLNVSNPLSIFLGTCSSQ
jgi:KR domain